MIASGSNHVFNDGMRHTFAIALLSTIAPMVTVAADPRPCVFCEIASGRRQTESVVYRDDTVVAFLSIGQRNPGHLLIVPVEHYADFLVVPADTMHHMTDVAKLLVEAIKRTDIKMDGFQLQMSNGRAAGQSVMHAHLHLIPRFEGDSPTPANATEPASRGETGQAETQPPPKREGAPFSQETLAPIATKIRAALAGR